MTGLQLILSVAAAFCLPGFGQLYQYVYSQANDRLDLAFKLQMVTAACLGLSMMGVGLLFAWFVIPICWLVGFVEAVMWALRQPQSTQVNRTVAVLVAACCVLGAATADASFNAPNEVQTAQLTRAAEAEETFDQLPSVKQPAAKQPAKSACGPACQKYNATRQPLRGRLLPRRGAWFRGGSCRSCGS